jgi:hypothetical protein
MECGGGGIVHRRGAPLTLTGAGDRLTLLISDAEAMERSSGTPSALKETFLAVHLGWPVVGQLGRLRMVPREPIMDDTESGLGRKAPGLSHLGKGTTLWAE